MNRFVTFAATTIVFGLVVAGVFHVVTWLDRNAPSAGTTVRWVALALIVLGLAHQATKTQQ